MHSIRLASYADVPAIAATLARAFDQDPLMRWVVGDLPDFSGRIEHLFAIQLRQLAMPGGLVWCGDDYQGACLWSAPGQWHLGILKQLRLLPHVWHITHWSRLITVLRAIDQIQHGHPDTPHYYLQVLGVDPAHQGKGWARPLLDIVLEQADRENKPAYLETANPDTLSLYRRFGFEVTRVFDQLPGGAPPVWCMLRPPRPQY